MWGNNSHPKFAQPKQLLAQAGTDLLTTTDWHRDGRPDVVCSSGGASGKRMVLLHNVADRTKAESQAPTDIPTQNETPYPVPARCDRDQDGDKDLLVASWYGYVYLLDGTFIAHGYAEVQVLRRQADYGGDSGRRAREK